MVKKDDKKTKPKEKAAPKKAEAPKTEAKAPKADSKKEVKKPEEKKPKKETAKKAAPKKTVKKKKAKKATKAFVIRGKRKECVARATIKEGKGVVRFNKMKISALNNIYVQEIINEPLRYVGPQIEKVDISVSVRGGGSMGQAQAARTAIAKALVAYFDDVKLREKLISIDRSLLVEDTRRVETKKFRGPKARARFQKSYR